MARLGDDRQRDGRSYRASHGAQAVAMTEGAGQSLTVTDLVRRNACRAPQAVAYRFLGQGDQVLELTNLQLEQKTARVAEQLLQAAAPGDRALLQLAGLDFVVGFLACLRAGLVAVPAPIARRNRSSAAHRAIVLDCTPRLVLSSAATRDALKAALSADEAWPGPGSLALEELDDGAPPGRDLPIITGRTLAFLQYTSGSTGRPKGVMLDHANLIHTQAMIRDACGHGETTHVVGWLPMFHDMGLIGNVLQPLYLGRAATLMSPEMVLQRPLSWLKAIEQYRATTSGGPNFIYDMCVDRIPADVARTLDLSSWTLAFNGAEPVRADTLARFAAHFAPAGFTPRAFHPCYGLAEATLRVCGPAPPEPLVLTLASDALEQNRVAPAGVGEKARDFVACGDVQGFHGAEVAIVDPVACTPAPAGQVGEIWVRGPNVARGYWRNPLATARTFDARLQSGEGGYLRTGDKGFVAQGQLFVTGRVTDMMVLLGRNIYPQDVETAVQDADPVFTPGHGAAFTAEIDGRDQLVVAQEICASARRTADAARLRATVRQAVTRHFDLSVRAVVLLKPGGVPRTTSGKVRRRACRDHFLSGDWPEKAVIDIDEGARGV